MNREHKIREGQVLLDDMNNYRPLEEPSGWNYSQERATNDQVTASRRLHWRHEGEMAIPYAKPS